MKRQSGGLVLLRRITPLARRDAVYFCSGAYTTRRERISLLVLRLGPSQPRTTPRMGSGTLLLQTTLAVR
ncbi:MAG TPA: hypothetical protein VN620_09095, partial [Candidatus Methylomirabilis sp.]|nr:hypothetical protein [Candidatus Methylomirabilis sp.]